MPKFKITSILKSKFIFVIAAIAIVTACTQDATTSNSTKPIVATTFTVIADMARNVAGEHIEIVSITKPGAEIHDYRPTAKDIIKAQEADLILWNGLNLELWFEGFFKRIENTKSVVVSEGVEPMGIAKGPYSGKPNPHAWMSPSDAKIYVDNIAKALSELDPENTDAYAQNATQYKNKIDGVSAPIHDLISNLPKTQRWLVTSEGAFSYFARDFGLEELYLWPINADEQGTPKQVKFVIDTIRKNNIPAVFSESTVSDKPAKQVARETGAHYGGVIYVDSLSQADGPVPSYLDLLRVTAQTIAQGLVEGAKK